jgi:hypothetical protein
VSIRLTSVLAIESLVSAVRSAAFVAPMGIGVQEATYALLGPLFGLGPELSLAVSLLKRARDLAIGVPALLTWQGLEGARLVKGEWGGLRAEVSARTEAQRCPALAACPAPPRGVSAPHQGPASL